MTTITATSRARLDSDDDGPSPGPGADNTLPAHDTAMASAIEVRRADAGGNDNDADAAWLVDRLTRAAALLAAPLAEVSITIVGDDRMRALHRTWKGVDEPTDVLTFRHSAPGAPIEADIAVCADEARRRASDLGHDPRCELLLYALHGLLHCAGHEDATGCGFAAMHAEEDRILEALGVGATFGRGGGGEAGRV